jgi:DNA-binding winged helix-turn-helix (wHTH) protein/tetratricopeptide (TPR) repeat protein
VATLYRYRFCNVIFDESKLELTIAGLAVDVQPRPLQILSLLLARGGEIVTREELFEQVWRGRPTVDNVLASAVTKLRNALGEQGAALIENIPRVGYRFTAPFERIIMARTLASQLLLKPGDPVPHRPHFLFERLISQADDQEVWTGVQAQDRRVFKLTGDGQRLQGLKREVTIGRLLQNELGVRPDIVNIVGWNFEEAPYFVETEYASEDLLVWSEAEARLANLSASDRLGFVLQIGDALSAAHGLGILHKDLKPSNIMVSGSTPTWQLTLADFGSAKLLDPERLDRLGITALGMNTTENSNGDKAGGTLLYIAPEILQNQPATIRSDVYALGILSFQLIVGDLRRPLTPGWEAEVTDDLLREDIQRATQGNSQHRFAAVDEFLINLRSIESRRIERVELHAQQAMAVVNAEALRRARARRPWIIATVASLTVGLAISISLYERLREARQAEMREFASARALNSFLTGDFIGIADPSVTGRNDMTVIEAARGAAARIDSTFVNVDPIVRASVHSAMQQSLEGLSDFPAAVDEGEKALAAFTQAGTDGPRVAAVHVALASELTEMSRLDEATQQLEDAEQIIKAYRLEGTGLDGQYYAMRAGVALDRLDLPQAVALYRQAWALVRGRADVAPDMKDFIEFYLADSLRMSSRYDDAEHQIADLLSRQEARLGSQHPSYCRSRAMLATIKGYRHDFNDAIPIAMSAASCLSKAVGPLNERTISAQNVLATIYFQRGDYARAASAYGQVAMEYASRLGPTSQRAVNSRFNTALSLQYAGNVRAAEKEFSFQLEAAKAALGWAHPTVQTLRYHLADCRLDLQRADDVENLLRDLDVAKLSEAEIEADWEGRLAYQQGRLALYAGEASRARPLLEKAAGIIAKLNPDGHITETMVRALIAKIDGR